MFRRPRLHVLKRRGFEHAHQRVLDHTPDDRAARLRGLRRRRRVCWGHAGQLAEAAPKEREVDALRPRAAGHEGGEVVPQALRLVVPRDQAELAPAIGIVGSREGVHKRRLHTRANAVELGLPLTAVQLLPLADHLHEADERLGEADEIDGRRIRLADEGVGKAAAHPGVPRRVVGLHEPERAVVERVATESRVVAVHVPLAVAHTQPLSDELCLALAHLLEHAHELCGERIGRMLYQ
mmetsp:Transcript_16462/g.35668  ORF Transcript_16462/g.35668 Transcript_16462/m.35668 type:complete len:238 (-) Transcript_16462:845-1558(-)